MVLSVDDVTAKFPVKTVPIIQGEPDYTTVNNMVQLLYGNAASLPTSLGGGHHGHIGLIMTPELFATLSPTPYQNPADPGITPQHAVGASAEVRQTNFLNHKEERRIFDNNNTMEDALKALIIDSVEDTYLAELRNKYTGYLGISARDLIDHLLDRYGKITAADIEQCKKDMHLPIDSTQPIDLYFQRIDDSVQYAADGNVAFTPGQILQTSYHAVSASGLYNEACKEWRRKPELQKTWAAFKQFFAAEYHDLKEQDKVNNNQNNFHGANATIHNNIHSANAAIDITQALDNLALAAISDRDIVNQLTKANQQLTETNTKLSIQLETALATNASLVAKIRATATPTTATTTETNVKDRRPPFDWAAWIASLDPMGYCWTHGYRVVCGHTSANCKGKAAGHIDTATRQNPQGGSTKGKKSS